MPKVKKKIKLSAGQKTALRLAAVLFVILLLLFTAAEALNIASVSQINDNVRSFFSSLSPGNGYPYQINSSSVRQMSTLNGNLFVLTDEKTLSLDTTAKQVKATQHTYSNPVMEIKGGKAIIYNRNDNRYRVENRSDTVYTGETPAAEKIITCAIGKKGNIALATLSDSATSKLTVLSSNYKEETFVWKCAQDSIVSVDLSNNGKYAAVAVVGARDGEIYSKIYIFDFRYAEPISEFEYFGTAIIDLNFATNDNVIAVGNNLTVFIKGLENEEKHEYGTGTLSAYTFSDDGSTVLVLSEYGSTNSEKLTYYTSDFKIAFEEKYTSNVKSVYAADSRMSVLLDDRVIVYRDTGAVYKEYEADSTSISVFNLGKKTYVYAIGKIVECSDGER